MKYFTSPFSLEKAEKVYKDLVKVLHPDKGGDTAEFQVLQREYELVKKVCSTMEKYPTSQKNRNGKKIIRRRGTSPLGKQFNEINSEIEIDREKLFDFLDLFTGGIVRRKKK